METFDAFFRGMNVLVTGGTGSLGRAIILQLRNRGPKIIRILSRDETRQAEMKKALSGGPVRFDFRIGDVRDPDAIRKAMKDIHFVIHTAAMKHVPICEKDPIEAVKTNVNGTQNLVNAIAELKNQVCGMVAISTDKACEPSSVMGMTKALMEHILIAAGAGPTKMISVRMGNLKESRGSVVPYFRKLAKEGRPLVVTHPEMTRFFLSLHRAAWLTLEAARIANSGEIIVPKMDSAKILDIALHLTSQLGVRGHHQEAPGIMFSAPRPGERIHEPIISKEECERTADINTIYAIQPALQCLYARPNTGIDYFTSADRLMSYSEVTEAFKLEERYE